jgi:cation diffusion facilitator family transporter
VKLFAGLFGRSAAMVADAVHSLSDSATDVVVLFGFRISRKPADRDHNFGHGKVETLSATIIGIALLAVGIRLLAGGSTSIYLSLGGSILPQPGLIALAAAILSIVVKEGLYHYTLKTGQAINSPAVIANAWHHRSDALSSVAALAGISGAILLGKHGRLLDPLAAVVVSVLIIKVAISILCKSLNELLEASLDDDAQRTIIDTVSKVPGALNPHNLKTRRIGSSVAITIHIEVDKNLTVLQSHDIATDVERSLRELFGEDTFVSVHIEPDGNDESS